MAARTFDLVLIQDPNHLPKGLLNYNPKTEDDPAGYPEDLLRFYRGSVPIKNLSEFCGRIFAEVGLRKRLIKNLIIGSHGSYTGGRNGVGSFYIGSTLITAGEGSKEEREVLRRVGPFLATGAHVYIMACRVANDREILQRISEVLGGVAVHGYTDYITTTSWGPLGVTLDTGTGDEGQEIVCTRGYCRVR